MRRRRLKPLDYVLIYGIYIGSMLGLALALWVIGNVY